MTKNLSKETCRQSNTNESLLALGKGIWPLIVSVFLVAIYVLIAVTMLFISYKTGRIQ